MADSIFSSAIWFDLNLFLAHEGLSFAMKMHKQLCPGEGRDLAWCSSLKGIISSWQGSGFSFKWFLEADRTSYECGLTFSSSWTQDWHKPDYSWCSLDVIKPSVVGKNVSAHGILILIVRPLPQELIYPYLWSLWIWRRSFSESLLRVQVPEVWVNHPTLPRGSKGVQGAWKYVVWAFTTVVAFCLPRTSEPLSLIALHARKHHFVVRKGGWMP